MGRVSTSELLTESTAIVNHFSHQHPLQLFKFQPHQTLNLPSCSACNLKPSDQIMYACLTCNYYLHQTCSRLPERITHHSHSHQLKLTLSPPYHNQVFSCDICKKTGSNQWIYRCDSCEFDAHLNCTGRSTLQVAPAVDSGPSFSPTEMFAMGTNRHQNQLMNQAFQQTGNDITSYNRILQGLIAGGAGGVGSASHLQGLMGGAGGVGNITSQLQGLMSGAGGAGSPLQALMGGGGAGGVNLQALMSGGGSGVNLQSLMGGSGGGDTAELLQSFIGEGGAGLFQGFIGGL